MWTDSPEARVPMSNREASQAFSYKPDVDFKKLLTFSVDGAAWSLFVMLQLGHNPGVQRITDIFSTIFKNPQEKRQRHTDFVCLCCGQRFEAKSKSVDKGFLVGPDLLERYAQDHAIIVFSYPNRVVAVEASSLWKHRLDAEYRVNRWNEPYLDFKDVKDIPLIFEYEKRRCAPQ